MTRRPNALDAAMRAACARWSMSIWPPSGTASGPSSYRALHAYLTGGYFGPLHGMPLDQIARADVAGRLVVISRENGPNTALLCRAKLGALFTWAMQMGLVEANPVIGTIPAGG